MEKRINVNQIYMRFPKLIGDLWKDYKEPRKWWREYTWVIRYYNIIICDNNIIICDRNINNKIWFIFGKGNCFRTQRKSHLEKAAKLNRTF